MVTYQESIWKDKIVWVASLMSKSGKMHRWVKPYIGRGGWVKGEAKNGMLLIEFNTNHIRAIPAGCVVEYHTPQVR